MKLLCKYVICYYWVDLFQVNYLMHTSCRTVCRLRADCSPLSTGILYGRLEGVTITDAVVIQFVLLKMISVLLEIC